MKIERDVLACATALLQSARDAERHHGWEAGDLLRTTLRLLIVAGVDEHGWSAEELSEDVHDLVEAVEVRNAGAASGFFDGRGATAH